MRGDGVLEQNIRPAVDRIVRAERPLGAVLLVPVGIAVFGRVERIASDIEIEAEAVQELNNVGAIGRSRGVELRKIRLAFKGLEDHDILFGLDIDLDIVRSLTGLMFAIGRADGVRLVILKDHSGVGSGSLLDLLRLLHCFCLDGVEIDVFTIKSGNFIGIEILVLIVSRFAVHIQLGNDLVGLLFPLRNIGHSLRDRCRNFGLPACEGVAGAGRGAVERGGRGILPKVRIDLIGENFFVLNAVGVGDGVYLRHRYAALLLDLPAVPGPDQRDRNDLLIVLDMFQILERRVERGHIAFGVIADVAKPVVPVLPRLADEVVFIALAEQTVGFRMLLRIIYDALDQNSHFKLFQLVSRRGLGLDRRPLRNIGHSLRDRCRNFGLPACEGVAGAGRGAVERGGRGILPKVRIDLIGENFFVLNAVGVGDGVYLRHRYAALLLDLPAVPGPDQRDRNDLLIVLDMFQILERRVERGHIAFGVIADVAKPVVPVLPRLADEVVFIALAEQTVGFRMLLRIIYDALDQNSHFKLFQLVSRRGFGLAGDLDDRADRPQAVHRDKLPLCILPNPAHRGDCVGVGVFVARKVFVKFFYVLIPKDRNGIRPDAIDLLNRWVGFCVAAKLRHVIPLFIRLVLAYYPNILLPAGNDRLCGRGHFMRGFDPRVRCRFHPLLIRLIIGEVERDGLRGRGVLHLPDQIAGLLHERCRPDSHRADISARAIAYDLADRMLCVGWESERILYRIMRSGCRNADNIYNNAGHVVFRGLGGLVGGRGVRLPNGVDGLGAVFMFNVNRAARLILRSGRSRTVSPALEGVAFLGRDLIADGKGNLVHRWMRCRTRLTSRRTGAAIRIILQFKEWHPDGVDGLGWIVLSQYDRLSALVLRSHSIRLVRPANVIIASAVLQLRCINIKREGSRRCGPIRYFREPRTVRAVVILIIQIVHVGRSGVGFLRDQINRIRCLRSSRTGGVEVKNCGVLLGLFRPANEFIARIQLAFQRRNADISELADQNRMIEARMACAILACIGLINRHAIVIASVELIADIKNLVLDCLCFIRFQRLRTDTVVSRKGRHRQHAEHHNQN